MLHQIGAGTLGPVFRAYEPDRERLVAIKLLRLDLPPERVHRLVTELELLVASGLTHSGIAAPLAAGIDGNSAYLVQEFVAAESLDIVVRDYGPAPPVDTLGLAEQLAGALDFAAGLNVTAGALHPRDVLVSRDEARLTGLGIARALEQVGVAPPVRRPYAAPERVAGGTWDRRADVFSLGAILHEMLWGRRIVGYGYQVAELLTELPGADLKALRAVFARALAEDPTDRFETALELAAVLKTAFPEIARRELPIEGAQAIDGRLPLDGPGAIDPIEIGSDIDLPFEHVEHVEHVEHIEEGRTMLSSNTEPPIEHEPHRGLLDAGRTELGASVIERSRSAIWPLALALVVGLALGFAAGYGVGSGDRTPPGAPPSAKGIPTRSAAPAGDLTEDAVSNPRSTAPTQTTAAPAGVAAGGRGHAPRPASPGPAAGRVLVRSTPAGARVFVDGRDRGRSPAAIRDLARGTHRVRIVHDGYATEERRVVISASQSEQSLTVALAPTRLPASVSAAAFFGSLIVDSRPIGASVFVDGRAVGTTPMVLPQVGAGEHVVRLEHNGYHRWSSSVRVVSGERNRVTASLER